MFLRSQPRAGGLDLSVYTQGHQGVTFSCSVCPGCYPEALAVPGAHQWNSSPGCCVEPLGKKGLGGSEQNEAARASPHPSHCLHCSVVLITTGHCSEDNRADGCWWRPCWVVSVLPLLCLQFWQVRTMPCRLACLHFPSNHFNTLSARLSRVGGKSPGAS